MNNKTENTTKEKERIYNILSTVNNIPSVPYIIHEVSNLIGDPKTSASILGKIISKDQGLVTKILTVANSPLYGIPRRVSTIDFAIVVLGFEQIKNIVIALSMMETLKTMGDRKFQQKKYWLHSIITAVAAQRIADDLGYQTSGEAFTAGLLHDLGILVIYKVFNNEYKQIIDSTKSEGISYLEAEEKYLGITHQEIGGFLVDKWNLPLAITDVIYNHHNPSLSKEHTELASLIHLADYMTQKLLVGNFTWDATAKLDENIIDILKLGDEDYLENFIFSYKDLFEGQLNTIRI
jgi:HD-like signal output (HDOD) protein